MAQYLRSLSSDSVVAGEIHSMLVFGSLDELATSWSQTAGPQHVNKETGIIGNETTSSTSELVRSNSWDASLAFNRHSNVVFASRRCRDECEWAQHCYDRPRAFAFIAHEDPATAASSRALRSRPLYAVQSSVIRSISRWKYFKWKLRRTWNSVFRRTWNS